MDVGEHGETEPSLEERVADLYDDGSEDVLEADAEEAQDEPEGEPEESLVEVEIAGIKLELTQEQADTLQKGYMQERDYTQKTQELADRRRALDVQAQEVQMRLDEQKLMASLREEQNQLLGLEQQLKQYQDYLSSNLEGMSTDDLVRLKHNQDLIRDQMREVQERAQKKQQEFLDQQAGQHKEYIASGNEYLRKRFGDWNPEIANSVSRYAVGLGFPEAEVKAVINPLYVEVLRKAQLYDELKAGQSAAIAKAKNAPPVIKPGSVRKMPEDVKQKLNFRKKMSGAKTSQDKAALIEERMAQKLRL